MLGTERARLVAYPNVRETRSKRKVTTQSSQKTSKKGREMEFKVTKTEKPKVKPEASTLKFGATFTDHMFVMEYTVEKGWHDGRIEPYGPISLDPSCTVFHYGQEMFEGLKAYKSAEGKVLLFRPEMNGERTNRTCQRLCMPEMDVDLYVDAVKAIVDVDQDWIPTEPGTSLYIRPFMIATQPYLGVSPSASYKFIIILSPVGPYYSKGLAPTSLYVEDKYARSVVGGTGEAKCGGNYAAGMLAQKEASEKGFDQILWLDGVNRKYVEEVGTSNAFFVIGDEVVTPPLGGTILPGITRNSVMHLLSDLGYKVVEKKITIDEVIAAIESGELKESFATGTAAVISPVGELSYKGELFTINNKEIGKVAQLTYDSICGIQTGKLEDKFGWTVEVK